MICTNSNHNNKRKSETGFCITCYTNERIQRNPEVLERMKASRRKWRYGLSEEEFKQRLEEQDNKCAICKEPFGEIYVDHDHTTGVVRGLLCHKCNSVLGYVCDNPTILAEAICYLEKHKN